MRVRCHLYITGVLPERGGVEAVCDTKNNVSAAICIFCVCARVVGVCECMCGATVRFACMRAVCVCVLLLASCILCVLARVRARLSDG